MFLILFFSQRRFHIYLPIDGFVMIIHPDKTDITIREQPLISAACALATLNRVECHFDILTLQINLFEDKLLWSGSWYKCIWETSEGIIYIWIEMYGYCTQPDNYGCYREGKNGILPPVMSARIRTMNKFSFRYGRMEIEAKMPVGDWMWPGTEISHQSSIYTSHRAYW